MYNRELVKTLQTFNQDLPVVIELEAMIDGEWQTRTLAANSVHLREFNGSTELVIRNFYSDNPAAFLDAAFDSRPEESPN